ncbi:MAG: hypothetical protein L6U16_10385 [Porphyromonadaceae bacterium]|nr:MAG: hypothetical protein L6U16_10385 [Porphyromonadaceae bacterium]
MNDMKFMTPERINKIKSVRVGILSEGSDKVLADSLDRMGVGSVVVICDNTNFEAIDVILCSETDIDSMQVIYEKAESRRIPIVFLFNFGIGSCVTIIKPGNIRPSFIYDHKDKTPLEWMLEYVRGYNVFWNIQKYTWLNEVEGWINSPEIRNSVGLYSTISAGLHVLAALIIGEEIKYYPKFYLVSMKDQPD